MLKEIVLKQRELLKIFIKIVQEGFITIVLFFIYYIGFGITLILVLVFNRRLLRIEKNKKNTFWTDAEGYDSNISACLKQV